MSEYDKVLDYRGTLIDLHGDLSDHFGHQYVRRSLDRRLRRVLDRLDDEIDRTGKKLAQLQSN